MKFFPDRTSHKSLLAPGQCRETLQRDPNGVAPSSNRSSTGLASGWFAQVSVTTIAAIVTLAALAVPIAIASSDRKISANVPGGFLPPSISLAGLTNGRALWSDGETMWVSTLGGALRAFNVADWSRDSSKDVTSLADAGNENPNGMWAIDGVMYVTDDKDHRVYAYNLEEEGFGERLPGREWYVSRIRPKGIWSDGTFVWILSPSLDAILAYTVDGDRRSNRDIETLRGHGNRDGNEIWSNGSTIWVADQMDRKIYAYRLRDGVRTAEYEFNNLRSSGVVVPKGIWSDGSVMYVYDDTEAKLYRFNFTSAVPQLDSLTVRSGTDVIDIGEIQNKRDFKAKVPSTVSQVTVEYTSQSGIDVTITPSDDADVDVDGHQVDLGLPDGADYHETRITLTATDSSGATTEYSITLKRFNSATISDDADLTAIGLSDIALPTFSPDRMTYAAEVENSVAETVLTYTKSDSAARAVVTPADADTDTADHEITLAEGANTIEITVTSSDLSRTAIYRIVVNRSSNSDFGWNIIPDFDDLGDHRYLIREIWSNGTTLWVTTIGSNIYAYELATMVRNPHRDIRSNMAAQNTHTNGLWSDGTVMVTSDDRRDRIFVYDIATDRYLESRSFDLNRDNGRPKGIWSDGATLWVVDHGDDKVYAYHWTAGARYGQRDSTKEFNLAAGHGRAAGAYSDGTTVWISDDEDAKIYAYDLQSANFGERVESKEFDTLRGSGNISPKGIWSNGTLMWVADNVNAKLYAYNLPSESPRLQSLDLSGIDFGSFSPSLTDYSVGLPNSAASVTTVTATSTSSTDFVVTVSPTDSDPDTDDHEVELPAGQTTEITVTVAHKDDPTISREYTVSVFRSAHATISDDATLSALNFGADLPVTNFSPGRRGYRFDVPLETTSVTLTATPSDANAEVAIEPDDADTAEGYQIDLTDASTEITVSVTSSDRRFTLRYTVVIRRIAKLTGLTIVDGNGSRIVMPAFDPDRTRYVAYAEPDADQLTLSTTIDSTGGIVSTNHEDEDADADGVQFSIGEVGTDLVLTIASTVGESTVSKTYTFEILIRELPRFVPISDSDIALDRSVNDAPRGIASDGTHMWVVQARGGDDPDATLYAYAVATGDRDSAKDIDLSAGGIELPGAAWTDGTHIWVTGATAAKAAAFNLSTLEHDSTKDVDSRVDVRYRSYPTSVWADTNTFWISEDYNGYIMARDASTHARTPDRDIDVRASDARKVRPETAVRGIWSDGATLWVVVKQLYGSRQTDLRAFDIVSGQRRSDLELENFSRWGVDAAWGLWGDGTTIWVSDMGTDRIAAFSLPANTDLASLSITDGTDDLNFGVFSAGTTEYTLNVANNVSTVTIDAPASDDNATVTASFTDADSNTDGEQLNLNVGNNIVTFTVTNGSAMRRYTITIERAAS